MLGKLNSGYVGEAVSAGIALGLVVVFCLFGFGGDYEDIFSVVAGMEEPYDHGAYWYPPWNTYALRLWEFLPGSLVRVWLFNVLTVVLLTGYWGTPAWAVLICPFFLENMFYGHPFEAFFLWGVTLAIWGRSGGRWLLAGVGLSLMAFKPQLGWAPALLVVLAMPKAAVFPTAFVVVTTLLDYVATGRWWFMATWQAFNFDAVAAWNIAPARTWGPFVWAWLPIGVWLFSLAWGDRRRELWVAHAVGLLLTPYWGMGSLWPLLAMAGCWAS